VDTREYLATFASFTQRKVTPKPEPFKAPEIKDWAVRKASKNSVFLKHTKILGVIALASLILVTLPLFIVHPPYGKMFLLSISPMLIIAFSWMLGCWWAWDKEVSLLYIVTVGAMPVRGMVYFGWMWLASTIPGVEVKVMVAAMIIYWILFIIPELAMFVEFSKKFPRSANITEPNE